MFFSTLRPYLVFLEPEGVPFMVCDLLGKKFRKVFIGQRCFRFRNLELGRGTRYLGRQRDACSLEEQCIEFVLSGGQSLSAEGDSFFIYSTQV